VFGSYVDERFGGPTFYITVLNEDVLSLNVAKVA
jgi:hypothetical protein